MRIKYINNLRIPTEKAYGYQICKMSEEFARLGAEIELWAPMHPKQNDLFSYYGLKRNFKIRYLRVLYVVKYLRFLGRASYYLFNLLYLLKLVPKKINKDAVIYSRNPEIVWLFSKRGRKTVFEAHNWPESKTGLYKYFLKHVDLIVCNSRGTENKYRENNLKKTITAPNGVDLEKFNVNKDKPELRKKLNLPLDKCIAMYVGHLYKWKGVDTIVGAAEILKDNKDIYFVIVGGYENDVQKYRGMCEEKGLGNIKFLGHQKKEDIPAYLLASDILLLPNVPATDESVKYTSPIKMFEYMASGRPIIASDLPSIKEILNEGNSILVPAGNAEKTAKKIKILNTDSGLGKRLSRKAFEDVGKYTWRTRAEKIIKQLS